MWTRHGECNDCGHCCQTFGRQPLVRDLSTVGDPAFYETRGFTPQLVDGEARHVLWVDWLTPCPQHVESRCAIYDTRPQTCRDFPAHPRDVVGTPCSYWFSEGTRRAGGLGSPAPVSVSAWMAGEAV